MRTSDSLKFLVKHPQTVMDPPPCFTVGFWYLTSYLVPIDLLTYLTPERLEKYAKLNKRFTNKKNGDGAFQKLVIKSYGKNATLCKCTSKIVLWHENSQIKSRNVKIKHLSKL